MARLRCEACEAVVARVPQAQARQIARSVCRDCQPAAQRAPADVAA